MEKNRKEKTGPMPGQLAFYREVLQLLLASKIPFLVGGTYAVVAYTGISRQSKDLDLFCHSSDYMKILDLFASKGFKTSVPDERWLAKIFKRSHEVDIIFGLIGPMSAIGDEWFKEKRIEELFGMKVPILAPTEVIWAKTIVQGRIKNDMADIMHVILKRNKEIDWKRLLSHMGQYWEMLLIIILYFRFVYPSEREVIPRDVFDDLLERLRHQMQLPTLDKKISRGRLLSRADYEIDVKEWGFEDLTAP
jgi:hypothetical protein